MYCFSRKSTPRGLWIIKSGQIKENLQANLIPVKELVFQFSVPDFTFFLKTGVNVVKV